MNYLSLTAINYHPFCIPFKDHLGRLMLFFDGGKMSKNFTIMVGNKIFGMLYLEFIFRAHFIKISSATMKITRTW